MPSPRRKRVSDEVMARVAQAIDILGEDEQAPRTKRQLEVISGLGHDAVARAFRQDATDDAPPFRLNEKMDALTGALTSSRRSPVQDAQFRDQQKIAELKQEVKTLNEQLDRYAMALFAHALADGSATPATGQNDNVVPIRPRRSRDD